MNDETRHYLETRQQIELNRFSSLLQELNQVNASRLNVDFERGYTMDKLQQLQNNLAVISSIYKELEE